LGIRPTVGTGIPPDACWAGEGSPGAALIQAARYSGDAPKEACHSRMSSSHHPTRPGEIRIGRGAFPSRIMRHQVVRPRLPIMGRRVFQEMSFLVVITVPVVTPERAVSGVLTHIGFGETTGTAREQSVVNWLINCKNVLTRTSRDPTKRSGPEGAFGIW
jgi:hypothetical protein